MLIEVSNTLTVENPTPEMVLWCKRNLTIPNPDYAKKSRMNLWLGNTPKVLSLYAVQPNRQNANRIPLVVLTASIVPKAGG